mmetsp:Transcript_4260/g.10856  ORF Transcript_4260/g.10856 Transcript_4260/m.10856 type:complete len:318 (-) Transcript_4260:965-1918(-)
MTPFLHHILLQLANSNVGIAISQAGQVEQPRERHQQRCAGTELAQAPIHGTVPIGIDHTAPSARCAAALFQPPVQVAQCLHGREHYVVKLSSDAIVQPAERIDPNGHLRLGLWQQLQLVHEQPRALPLLGATPVEEHHEVHQELEGVPQRHAPLGVEGILDIRPSWREVDGVESTRGVEPEPPPGEILLLAARGHREAARQLPVHQPEQRAVPSAQREELGRVRGRSGPHGAVGRVRQEGRDLGFGEVGVEGGAGGSGAVGSDLAGEDGELARFEDEPCDLFLDEPALPIQEHEVLQRRRGVRTLQARRIRRRQHGQ